ncbi:MAG: NADH-quinone oxidoreductase subunit NuoH [Phycisphaerales bacterium]|nr:NADH-quinone oxidoreductase subunit NuoH [Phycisphaerales bacterium]
MSQITLPWIEKSPETLSGYRRKAILLLFVLAVGHLGIALVSLFAFKPGQLADWKIPFVLALVLGASLAGMAFTAGAFGVVFYRIIGKFLRWSYVAFALFLGGVVGACLIVWLHAEIFTFIKGLSAAEGEHRVWLLAVPYDHTVRNIYAGLEAIGVEVPVLAYALWPLQFEFIRDLVALGGIIGFISIIPAFGIWWERKVSARIQSRMGPMRVGGWHGWLQSPADGLKLIFKEDIIPPEGDPLLFRLAVYITFVPPICAFLALPFAAAWVFRDLDVALIFILAMLGIEVVGVILAGWASNNKWAVYGSMREACQMVSYEIPMGMSLLIPIMMAGSLKLTDIAGAQAGGFWNWFVFANPWCFIAFFTYYCAALASCKRAPFDLPESESELVAGFLTEYSGFRWSLFFFGEYAAMFIVAGLAVILFLGGWSSPIPEAWINSFLTAVGASPDGFFGTLARGLLAGGPIIFVLKATFLFYVQLWVRWTLPRVRIDQVLYACVQVMLPLVMVLLLANTLWILGTDHLQWGWLNVIDGILHWILVGIGVIVALAILCIALYGFKNNKRLVGQLAVVDQLPGS